MATNKAKDTNTSKGTQAKAAPVGIDNRNESNRRYGELEPEGYSRHAHGNREGEFQRGGKAEPDVPVEQSAPMKEARYRNEQGEERVTPDQYGGKTFDTQPGDRDITDDLTKSADKGAHKK
jgi:hypothetical protein